MWLWGLAEMWNDEMKLILKIYGKSFVFRQ